MTPLGVLDDQFPPSIGVGLASSEFAPDQAPSRHKNHKRMKDEIKLQDDEAARKSTKIQAPPGLGTPTGVELESDELESKQQQHGCAKNQSFRYEPVLLSEGEPRASGRLS